MKCSRLAVTAAVASIVIALSACAPAPASPESSGADVPSAATPSAATPSTATLSTATLSTATPSTATPNAAAPAAAPLDGSAWVLVDITGKTAPPGPSPTLRFEGGRALGTDGCNRYTAPYKATGTALEIGPRAASTMRACAAETMEQAEAFLAALTRARGFRRTGNALALTGADGKDVATFAAQSQALVGTLWRAAAINNGKAAVVSLVDETPVTLGFGTNGRASGSTGCNSYTVPYEQQGTRLKFGAPNTAGRMCANPALTPQEQQFLKALETVTTLRIEGDHLELRTAKDALALSLERMPF